MASKKAAKGKKGLKNFKRQWGIWIAIAVFVIFTINAVLVKAPIYDIVIVGIGAIYLLFIFSSKGKSFADKRVKRADARKRQRAAKKAAKRSRR